MADKDQTFIKHMLVRLAEHLKVGICPCVNCSSVKDVMAKSEHVSSNPTIISLSKIKQSHVTSKSKSSVNYPSSGGKPFVDNISDSDCEESIFLSDSGFGKIFDDDFIVQPFAGHDPGTPDKNGLVSNSKLTRHGSATNKRQRCSSPDDPIKEARIHLSRCDDRATSASVANLSLVTNETSEILTVTLNDSMEDIHASSQIDKSFISAIEAIPPVEKFSENLPQENSCSLSTQGFEQQLDQSSSLCAIDESDRNLLKNLVDDQNFNKTSPFLLDSLRKITTETEGDAPAKPRKLKSPKSSKVADFGKKLGQMYEEDFSLWDKGRILNGSNRCNLYQILNEYEKRSDKKADLAVVRYVSRKLLEKRRGSTDTLLDDKLLPCANWCYDELASYIRFKAFLSA